MPNLNSPLITVTLAGFISLLISLLVVSGCGGSGQASGTGNNAGSASTSSDITSSPGSEGPFTKAEFIKQGDAICDEADKTIYKEGPRYRNEHAKELKRLSPVAREEQLIRAVVLPTVLKEARDLEALGAPKGGEKQVESLIAGVDAGVRKARKNPYAIEGEFGYGENPFQAIDVRLREYGFKVCAIIT